MWSDWLVYCDCAFHSVCPLMDKDKRLMEASWWRDWLWGKLGLVLMCGAMFSKSLIRLLLVGWAVFPLCCLTWSQTMVEVLKIMVTSFKRSDAVTAALSAHNLATGHHRPTPLPETPGHSWAYLGQFLMGSLLLSPGSWCAQDFICALQESLSAILIKFW